MRIVQFTPTLHPTVSFGGGSGVCWFLSRDLALNGDCVTVVSTDAGDSGRRLANPRTQDKTVEVIRVPNLSNHLAYKARLFLPRARLRFYRGVVDGADIIHSHDYRTLLNLLAIRAASRKHIPIIVQPHGTINPEYRGKQSLKRLYDSLVGKKYASKVDAWIALSSQEHEHLRSFGIPDDRIYILPNGIDIHQFIQAPGKDAARKTLGIDAQKKVLLFVGRVHKIKGLDMLLKCLPELSKDLSNIKLLIVGPDDGDTTRLVNLTSQMGLDEKVDFLGLATGQKKTALFAAADVFVLPSISEAFPISVLEACGYGLPVVLTRNSEISGLVDNRAGYSVDRTVEHMSKAIMNVLTNPEVSQRFAAAGRQLASEHSWTRVARLYRNLYESLTS